MRREESAAVERVFTIELDARSNLKDVSAPRGSDRVVIEGTIGALQRARFVEDTVLELTGSGGVLRVDLSRDDLAESKARPIAGEKLPIRRGI